MRSGNKNKSKTSKNTEPENEQPVSFEVAEPSILGNPCNPLVPLGYRFDDNSRSLREMYEAYQKGCEQHDESTECKSDQSKMESGVTESESDLQNDKKGHLEKETTENNLSKETKPNSGQQTLEKSEHSDEKIVADECGAVNTPISGVKENVNIHNQKTIGDSDDRSNVNNFNNKNEGDKKETVKHDKIKSCNTDGDLKEICNSYEQQISDLNIQIRDLTEKLEVSNKEKKSLEVDNRFLNLDFESAQDELKEYDVKLKDYFVQRNENRLRASQIIDLNNDIESLTSECTKLNNEKQELQNKLKKYGPDPDSLAKERDYYYKIYQKLDEELKNLPGVAEISVLRKSSEDHDKLKKICNDQIIEIDRLNSELGNVKSRLSHFENNRCSLKLMEMEKNELQSMINRYIHMSDTVPRKIFANLSKIDEMPVMTIPRSKSRMNLKEFCERFRLFMSKMDVPLYYDETTVRAFIAGLASSRLIILEGMSGTGKSSLPIAFSKFMGAVTDMVPVQSSWKDRNDLLGFYNDFKKQYKETQFLKALYSATCDPDTIHCIVLDEMNLSRIEYYFADFLSVLEDRDSENWKVELISDYASISINSDDWPERIKDGNLRICDNTWFIGTANKDDSTFTITDKVYDRANVINFDKKGEYFEIKENRINPCKLNREDFLSMFNVSWRNDKVKKDFHEKVSDLDNYIRMNFEITFGNRILDQMERFVPVFMACGGTSSEALDFIFANKILRKLEGYYDEGTKEKLESLSDWFIRNSMPMSKKRTDRMVSRI